mmetsp:Transcript_32397/g.66161  ORF Transcript_32397/g.66161 Transcript_32397/m.66161 type:complete len:224 (+) Transcript_32397:861-1532(+)
MSCREFHAVLITQVGAVGVAIPFALNSVVHHIHCFVGIIKVGKATDPFVHQSPPPSIDKIVQSFVSISVTFTTFAPPIHIIIIIHTGIPPKIIGNAIIPPRPTGTKRRIPSFRLVPHPTVQRTPLIPLLLIQLHPVQIPLPIPLQFLLQGIALQNRNDVQRHGVLLGIQMRDAFAAPPSQEGFLREARLEEGGGEAGVSYARSEEGGSIGGGAGGRRGKDVGY